MQILLGLIRHLLTVAGGALITKGYTDAAGLEQLIGALLTLVGVGFSVLHKVNNPQFPPEPPLGGRGGRLPLLALTIFTLLTTASGCASLVNSDKIVAVKSRVFGIIVGENPATQIPEVKLGFVSTVYQMIPTSTNGPVFAPKYADYFDLKQSANPFNTGIEETTGTGDVRISSPDSTNSISSSIPGARVIKSEP